MPKAKTTVLVVEDSTLIRMGMAGLALAAGFEVLEASDADEAIRLLEDRSDIDLVFTDVGMPGAMDGVALSHHIRDRWPPVKLIVASGQTVIDESHLPEGARFFLKPYDGDVVIDAIATMVAD